MDNPGVLEKFKEKYNQEWTCVIREQEKQKRKEGKEGGKKEKGNLVELKLTAFVFASYQDGRCRALSGVES